MIMDFIYILRKHHANLYRENVFIVSNNSDLKFVFHARLDNEKI